MAGSQQPVATPQGVVYKWTQDQIEFQLFPESYFTGADVKIYFGDVWVDDILGITFVLQENVKPLFSYASYTYKEVSRGNRMVTGRFYIAFREAGYISAVFDHLGQLGYKQAVPDLVNIMQHKGIDEWQAVSAERWEEIVSDYWKDTTEDATVAIDGTDGEVQRRTAYYEKEIWGRTLSQDTEHEGETYFYRSRRDNRFQPAEFAKDGFDIYMTYGPMESGILKADAISGSAEQYDRTKKTVSFNTTVKAIRRVQITGVTQDVTPDGEVIEVYDFIAKDLD